MGCRLRSRVAVLAPCRSSCRGYELSFAFRQPSDHTGGPAVGLHLGRRSRHPGPLGFQLLGVWAVVFYQLLLPIDCICCFYLIFSLLSYLLLLLVVEETEKERERKKRIFVEF